MTGRALLLTPLLAAGVLGAQEAPNWSVMGPFFTERCTMCHSGADAPLGLQLDSYRGAMAGSWTGPVLRPGDVEGSELLRRVRGLSQPQMPLVGEPLTEEEIGRIESWILAGLPEGAAAPSPEGAVTDEGPPAPAGEAVGQDAGPALRETALGEATQEAPFEEPVPGEAGVAEAPARDDAVGSLVPGQTAEGSGAPAPDASAPPGPGEPVTFAHVERIFLRRCVECHSDAREGGPPEGLRLDSLERILAGGERLVLVPGNPEASEIVRRIEGTAQPRMPFDGPPWLDPAQTDLIRRWIAGGAADAEVRPAPMPVGREVRFRGVMTGPEEIDGIGFAVTGATRIDDRPEVGEEAEVRGVVAEDGGIGATRLRDR